MKIKESNRLRLKLLALILAVVMALCSVSCFGDHLSNETDPLSSSGSMPSTGEKDPSIADVFDELLLIEELFKKNTLFELDDEALMTAVLKGYIAGTGDKYAEYFTAEEYEALTSQNRGELVGVGISVVQNTKNNCAEIINVFPDSPALEAGVRPGDLITYIGIGNDRKSVAELGYTMALDLMAGVEGTNAEFVVQRDGEEIEFSITRRKVTVTAVSHHVYTPESGQKIGIVEMTEFDLTTPVSFENAVDSLLAEGCEHIIFDVRNNPGGDLNSIIAVLAFFLEKDDVVIRTSDRAGNETVRKIAPARYSGDYAGCSISEEDIGKYKDLSCAVLTNGNTASAAELFSAALKDHKVSFTVGTTTYGKGTMQTILRLDSYGYSGALKLTTRFYYPPFSDSYEGEGITPDVPVELAEELKDTSIYLIDDEDDNQLAAAIEALNERAN